MPLWLAHWGAADPDHEPWASWLFWQNAGDQIALWCEGGADYDYFNGSIDDLRALAGGSSMTIEQRLTRLEEMHGLA